MSRKTREIKKNIKVFCEGDTEYHYIDAMKRQLKLSIVIKPVNMRGGGYSSFLEYLRTDGSTNCLVKLVIIDGDRAVREEGEKKNLQELIDYCSLQNECKKIPHMLIMNYTDFEYISCLHVPKYKGQDVKRFIEKEMGYKCIDDFKRDQKIYQVLNSHDNSIENMLGALKRNQCFVTNEYSVDQRLYEVKNKIVCDWNRLGYRGSNIDDFFGILSKLHT